MGKALLAHSFPLAAASAAESPVLGPRLRYLPSSRELRYLQPAYLESNTEQDGDPGLCPREGAVSHCLGTWLLQARTDPDCSLLVLRPPGGQLLGQKDLPSEMKRVKKKNNKNTQTFKCEHSTSLQFLWEFFWCLETPCTALGEVGDIPSGPQRAAGAPASLSRSPAWKRDNVEAFGPPVHPGSVGRGMWDSCWKLWEVFLCVCLKVGQVCLGAPWAAGAPAARCPSLHQHHR